MKFELHDNRVCFLISFQMLLEAIQYKPDGGTKREREREREREMPQK